jgi:GR25 family glycosyltransferase involved in LPS biosynthesis
MEDPFSKLSLAQLKFIAKSSNIKGYSNLNKKKLLDLIKNNSTKKNLQIIKKEIEKSIKKNGENEKFIRSPSLIFCKKKSNKKIGNYVINCQMHSNRMKNFKTFAKRANLKIQKEECVNGRDFTQTVICNMIKNNKLLHKSKLTPIELSICISHYNVWRRSLNSCDDYALVLEDDVKVSKDFVKNVNKIMEHLTQIGQSDFSILFLWNGNWMMSGNHLSNVTRVPGGIKIKKENINYNAGCVCYIISKKFMEYAMENFFPIKYPVDIWIGSKYKIGNHLTLKMKKYKKHCYKSPILRLDYCEGEESTQNYDLPTVETYVC